MAEEENTTTMNLDLNLGPVDNNNNSGEEDTVPSYPVGTMNLQDWLDSPARSRHRNHRWRSLWRQIPITPETRDLALELIAPENGEASNEAAKTLEEDDGNKKDSEENSHCEEEGSFFDCNICLDMSKDPVVTCCGHLFCWTCLYRWLHHHSDAKECPVCKGEVTAKNVTPIYGRGNNNNNNNNNNNSARVANTDSSLKIPLRPQARRVESWRQAIQRSAFTIPMEEMIRRLGSTFDLSRERSQVQSQDLDGPPVDSTGINNNNNNNNNSSLLNRILTSRGLRRERAPLAEDVIDLTAEDNNNNNSNNNNNNSNNYSTNRRLSSMLLRRSSSHRATSLSNLASALQSAESLAAVESYFNNSPVDGEQGRGPHVDDRDSVSSIAAVIQSESQTVDNTVEIDSRVSLSTSSSRRRVDASRISDVDSGDSRAPRRRRLN